jgi:hypothetical protein
MFVCIETECLNIILMNLLLQRYKLTNSMEQSPS